MSAGEGETQRHRADTYERSEQVLLDIYSISLGVPSFDSINSQSETTGKTALYDWRNYPE